MDIFDIEFGHQLNYMTVTQLIPFAISLFTTFT